MGFRSFKLPKGRAGIFQSQLHSHPASGYRDTSAAIEKNRFRATKRNVAVRLIVVKTLNVYLVAVISNTSRSISWPGLTFDHHLQPRLPCRFEFFNKVSREGRGTSNLLQHLETYIRNTSFNRRDRDKLSLTSFEGLAGKGRGDTMIIKYSPVSFERIRGRSFYFV